MSDDFSLITHCVVCREPRSMHPTESNNPRPLFNEGRACRDCDSYITAARVYTVRLNQEQGEEVIGVIRNFLNLAAGIRIANKRAVEMMQAEADRLSAEQTKREEEGCPDCGYIADDRSDHYPNCVHFDGCNYEPEDMEDWS